MELNSLTISGAPRPSASIILLRDGTDGLEVFLLKRHGASDVLAGAYVFAGGKVDPSDGELDTALRLDQSPESMALQLGEPDLDGATAASLFVAGVRELFEESGVLLAEGATKVTVDHATSMQREGHQFEEVLDAMDLRLQTRGLVPFSRWITPKVPSLTNKRFDARFFLSTVPAGQLALHDNREAVDSVWLTPRAALRGYGDGALEIAPPQIMSLVQLAGYRSTDDALADMRTRKPPRIAPESFTLNDTRVVCYPGDPRHSEQLRAMPGPTRLFFRNGRFEPEGGMDGLLSHS